MWSIQKIFQLFLDDLEHIPDLKCILDLECILDNMNAFLILNFLFKNFCSVLFCSFTNCSNIFKKAFYSFVIFLEWWDRAWSFWLFLWKNDLSPRTTPALPLTYLKLKIVVKYISTFQQISFTATSNTLLNIKQCQLKFWF